MEEWSAGVMEKCNEAHDRSIAGEAGRRDVEARGCLGLSVNDEKRSKVFAWRGPNRKGLAPFLPFRGSRAGLF